MKIYNDKNIVRLAAFFLIIFGIGIGVYTRIPAVIAFPIVICFMLLYAEINHFDYARLLTNAPVITILPEKIIAETSKEYNFITLFSYRKYVEIDKIRQIVQIKTRYLWLKNKIREIPFDRIKGIDYSYEGARYSKYYPREKGDDYPLIYGGWGEVDYYSISLWLIKPDEKVRLFFFESSPSKSEEYSRNFVELVMSYTGKRLMKG